MSCEPEREGYLTDVCGGAVAESGRPLSEELERLFQQERALPENRIAAADYEAKTRLLFAQFPKADPPRIPPTHSQDGLPKPDARRGYAKLYERLTTLAASGVIPRCPDCGQFGVTPGHSTCTRSHRLTRNPHDVLNRGAARAASASDGAGGAIGAIGAIGGARAHAGVSGMLRDRVAGQEYGEEADEEYEEYDEEYDVEIEADGGDEPDEQDGRDASALALIRRSRAGRATATMLPRYDREGYDKHGYNVMGFDRNNKDREGFDYGGWDAQRRNRLGYDWPGFDKEGRDWLGFGKNGYNEEGLDRFGYNRQGFDQEGYNKHGYDKEGYNRHGHDREGYNKAGIDYYGYSRQGLDKNGWTFSGYKDGPGGHGLDADGYDVEGLDGEGYDRHGYNLQGRDRAGNLHPWLIPDTEGYYGDGRNAEGFDREGYNYAGLDRWGFNRQGLNGAGRDRTGRDKDGYDTAGRDVNDYDKEGFDRSGYDRLGYDKLGFARDGYTVTGYDKDGYNHKGLDRHGRDRDNKDARTGRVYKSSPYNKSGYDKEGYDRWGFHRHTGLTEDGRNYVGWVYDPASEECYNPAKPTERMPHSWAWVPSGYWTQFLRRQVDLGRVTWTARPTASSTTQPYKPKITPLDAMSKEEWEAAYGTPFSGAQTHIAGFVTPVARRWEIERLARDPDATARGVLLKCPHCGQFTGGNPHNCPHFNNQQVSVYRSGLACRNGTVGGVSGPGDWLRKGGQGDKGDEGDERKEYSNRGRSATNPNLTLDGIPVSGLPPHHNGLYPSGYSSDRPYPGTTGRDLRYNQGGYDAVGRDQEGFDRQGYNTRGFNRKGRDAEGFDIFGYDEEGRDSAGYDRNDLDRDGNLRARHLDQLVERYTEDAGNAGGAGGTQGVVEGDVLANAGMANMYRQIVSAITGGEDWKVEFTEDGLGATNMVDTIWVNPYPLGRDVPPVANVAVTRGVLYHEMGHVLKTPPPMWQRALRIARGEEKVEGLEGAAPMLPQVLNIVEDGRMERAMSAQFAGAAEAIAAGCRLFPRWDERVGPGVEMEHQVLGALINECRPYYRLRQETMDAMTPHARELLDELRPLARTGVLGTADDTFDAAVEITRRLQKAGIETPDPQFEQTPAFVLVLSAQGEGEGTGQGEGGEGGEGGQPGQGRAQGESGSGSGQGGQAGQPGQGGSGSGQGGNEQGSGAGAGTATGGQSGQSGQSGQCPSCGRFVNSQGEGHAESCPQQGQAVSTPGAPGAPGTQATPGDQAVNTDGSKGAEGAEGADNNSKAQNEQSDKGQDDDDGHADEQQAKGSEAPAKRETSTLPPELRQFDAPFTDEQFMAAISHIEAEAVKAVEVDLRRQGSVEYLGRRLHEPLDGRKERSVVQAFRTARGEASSVQVSIPRAGAAGSRGPGGVGGGVGGSGGGSDEGWVKSLEPRRKQQERIADDMAYRLALIRDQVEERLGMQSRGDLDRSEFVAAVKGARDVYEQTQEQPRTAFAASVCVDLSGSMNGEMSSGALYDAVGVLAATFDHQSLQMPYEVRGFSDGSLHYKAMGDTGFDPARHAMLIKGPGGGTSMRDTAGLATTALRARPERNKLLIALTDGALSDHNETASQLRAAREGGAGRTGGGGSGDGGGGNGAGEGGGVVTFGIYLARGAETPPAAQMDDLYGGRGNWATINNINQMPEKIAQRIADIMQSLG